MHRLQTIPVFLMVLCAGRALAAPSLPMLKTQGARWVDASGRPVVLRGCNLGNWLLIEMWMHNMRAEGIPDQYAMEEALARRFGQAAKEELLRTYRENYITARDFAIIRSFGMNVVRIPIWYRLLMDDDRPYEIRPHAWLDLDRAVDLAEAAGIYTIIDLHGAPGGQNPWHHCGRENRNELWGSEENQRRTVWIWRQIAAHYRGRTAVAAYDLLNEPYTAPEAELRDLVLRLYQAVREVDPDHIIVFPATPAGFEFYGRPADLGMTNVAFTCHFYPGFFGWGSPEPGVHLAWLGRGVLEWRDRVEAAGAPLLVGEMNVVLRTAGGPQMMRRAFDTYAGLGWATTMWSYKVFTREGDIGDGSWGMVTNPSGAGAPLVKADTWTPTRWDCTFADAPARRRTRFTAPGDGPTQVYVVIKAGAIEGRRLDVAVDNIGLTDEASGEQVIANGNFGDPRGWAQWRHAGSVVADYAFADGPSAGRGPCLRLTANGYANGGVYQKVALRGGRTYRLDGALKDLGSDEQAAWLEVYIHAAPPVDGQDYIGAPAPGSEIDLNTSTFDEIKRYFESFSTMDYVVYDELRTALTSQ